MFLVNLTILHLLNISYVAFVMIIALIPSKPPALTNTISFLHKSCWNGNLKPASNLFDLGEGGTQPRKLISMFNKLFLSRWAKISVMSINMLKEIELTETMSLVSRHLDL